MPTAYEAKVNAVKAQVLQALREHSTDAERAAVHFFSAASPSSAVPQPGGGPALALRPPAAAEAAVLAAAVQAAALELVARAAGEGVAVSELRVGPGEQPALAHLLDATLWLAGQAPAPVDLALPAACVEAVLEAAATGECEGVVAYLHSRLAQFQRPGVFQKSKHTLLRACTLLLARLAKSQHAPLRGRVLCVLAKLMPLTEPSGLNRGGAFNAGNATPVEEVGEGAVDAEGRPVDASLYASFWGLQAWFAAPASVLAGGKWGEVCRGLGAALDALAAARVTVGEAAAGGRGGEGGGEGGGGGQGVKYLSSARLLPLQLRDATFRRHFLVQALVLLGWCEAPTLKEWAGRGLKGRALEELAQLRGRVYAALEATPDCGPAFAAAVRSALRGEEAWVAWKARGCPREVVEVAPAAPPAGAAAAEAFPPRKRRRPSAEAVYGVGMGTDELDRLWNLTEDNTSALGADDRGGFRSLRQLMEPVIEEMNEPEGEEGGGGMLASQDAVYSWKTLRLVARDSLPAFADAVRRGGDLRVAARALYPAEVPPEEAPQPEAEPEAEAEVADVKQEAGVKEEEDAAMADAEGEGEAAAEAAAAQAGGASAGEEGLAPVEQERGADDAAAAGRESGGGGEASEEEEGAL